MMLITQSCFAVAILTHTVTAFVPWIPDYRCKEFNTCIGKRTSADTQVENRGLEHVEIIQRVAEVCTLILFVTSRTLLTIRQNQLPHDVQVQRLAERLYNKYQRDSPSKSIDGRDFKVVPAAVPTTSTSLGIDQDGTDFSYYAKIQVGSNNQVMNMALDTGAGTTWVMGKECQAEACKIHNNFDSSSSTTFNGSSGLDFELHYGSGHVTGKLASDTLTLAGFTIKPIIGIANNASTEFKDFPIDGILGLAQSKGDQDTFVETLAKSKILPANRFGVSIGRATDGPNVGVINFGTLDNTRYSGDLTYFPVPEEKKKEGEWALAMSQISFGDKNINIENKVAYIDTGTSYIFAKEEEVKKLHDIVPGSFVAVNTTGTWRVPCDTTTEIVLTFGSKTYTIAPRDWVGPKVDGNCTSNIYGYDVVEGAWLLGDTFLKNVYAVFDFDAYQVGESYKSPRLDPLY